MPHGHGRRKHKIKESEPIHQSGLNPAQKLGLAVGLSLAAIVAIVLGAVLATELGSREIIINANTSPPHLSTTPVTFPPQVPSVCIPPFAGDPNGSFIRLNPSGFGNDTASIPNLTQYFNTFRDAFVVAYWFRFPTTAIVGTLPLNAFCRAGYDLSLVANPVHPTSTPTSTVTLQPQITFQNSGIMFQSTSKPIVDLTEFNFIVYALNVDRNAIPYIVTGFQCWINSVPLTIQSTVLFTCRASTGEAATVPLNCEYATLDPLSGDPLQFGDAFGEQQVVVDLQLLSIYPTILTTAQVELLQEDTGLTYAMGPLNATGAYYMGKGDTSGRAFYSQTAPSCVNGLLSPTAVVMDGNST